jgi:ABC-type Na+ efflux pump permease subunit
MKKLWAIAYKDIRSRFTDRTLLLIMLAAPLAISTIIGLAFGGLGRTTSPIQNIPVAVINNDQPGANGVPFGAYMSEILTTGQLPAATNSSLSACPPCVSTSGTSNGESSQTIGELIKGTAFDTSVAQGLVEANKISPPSLASGSPQFLEQAGRAAVDRGIYTALVIIPSNFSMGMASLANPQQTSTNTTITIYGNAGQGLSAGIVRSVVDSITSQMVSGNIAIGATLSEIAANQPALLANVSKLDFGKLFVCAFTPCNNLVQLAEVPVQAAPTSSAGTLLVTFGSAQAMFFALFTGQFGILSMYEERKNWTLQRILTSPTPRWTILGGKLVGVLASVLFQLLILIFALTAVGSLIEGQLTFIWGHDIGKLALLLVGVAIAASGLGIFLAGVLKGIEQANVVGSVLNIALGVLGGGFGFQLPRSVAQFSFIYWARDAFDTLAAGRGDISLNILVLFVEGVLLFGIGLILFSRKFEV